MFRVFRDFILRISGRRPPTGGPALDPFARVRHPRRGGPGSRTSGIALMEPEPDRSVDAVGRGLRRRW